MIGYSLSISRAVAARRQAIVPAVVAFAVGLLLIFGAGFLQIPAVHDAAHDTRHSVAFPCH